MTAPVKIAPPEAKPLWRGWIHVGMAVLAPAAGIVLIVLASGVTAKVSAVVFTLSAFLLFGNSAVYHRFNWGPRVRAVLKRIDHANILLLIAGTYTPISVLALSPEKATLLLVVVWSVALAGILFRVLWIEAPRWLYVALYIGLGWAALAFVVDFFVANWLMMLLVLIGGVCYSLGAVVYALKKPNPVPGVFGFHEVFHSLTALAFGAHWCAALLVCLNPIY